MKGPFNLLDERFSITRAAAPSDTIEQSERFKGGATIGFFSGRGFHDYFADGNSIPNNATLTANTSPAGDILFSTKGFVAGDNYTIILEIR